MRGAAFDAVVGHVDEHAGNEEADEPAGGEKDAIAVPEEFYGVAAKQDR